MNVDTLLVIEGICDDPKRRRFWFSLADQGEALVREHVCILCGLLSNRIDVDLIVAEVMHAHRQRKVVPFRRAQ